MKFTASPAPQPRPILPNRDDEREAVGWGVQEWGQQFTRFVIPRHVVGPHDVRFDMKYCGICHSDVHVVCNEMSSTEGTMYPVVPGHELVGTVVEVGASVTKVAVGDNVAVGCIRDSCLDCDSCASGDENYCEKGFVHTYNTLKASDYEGHIGGNPDTQNFGGYSSFDVVHEHFVYKLPSNMPLEKAGPLVCAGITMWDPLAHWGATSRKDMTIGIVGVGGLGTMGIKLASALGHHVVAISSSPRKEDIARSKGARDFIVSSDPASLARFTKKLDLILNTVSAPHDISPYIGLLKTSGTLVQIGCVTKPVTVHQMDLMFERRSIAGSLIGGVPSTQAMLDFCAQHDLYPDVEVVTADRLDQVYTELQGNNSGAVRFVLDIEASLKL